MRKGFTLAEALITLGIIGVVAALTLPSLIQNYKKNEVENKLKVSYSLLSQAIKSSQVDNETLDNWDFTLSTEDFTKKYIIPYVKTVKTEQNNNDRYKLYLSNGTTWELYRYYYTSQEGGRDVKAYLARVLIDINGSLNPNRQGRDMFYFYILPTNDLQGLSYGDGNGAFIKDSPKAGLYYDGYGFTDDELRNDPYRACAKREVGANYPTSAFCIGIIIRNGWKIPDDYPITL